ncbi:MAG: RdgB/HAM1 family non-canonical purine NTP pyrophosphatase [Nitrososphaera sp.]|uniref:RdgB/HAM1 family non-canonical purine NTP pyrophosphatase n=1 Tax=Nitrososphaera sp. TaxID=1971748 RepID=UPI003D6E4A1B
MTFASTNQKKFDEVKSILALRIAVDFAQAELVEVQSDSLEEIAREKAKSAYARVGKPVIVEDDGLYIDSLKGFPGQYSSFVFKTLGNAGILKLLEGLGRQASFRSIIAYYDGKDLHTFEGTVNGAIATRAAQGGWGYDPIFIPEGAGVTFAELANNKNDYSHRKRALDKFAEWFTRRD